MSAKRVYHDSSEAFLADDTLGPDDYRFAADKLEVKPSVIQAIAHIESLQRPFSAPHRPIIRIEPHWWRKLAYSPRARKEIDELKPLNPDDQAIRWEHFEWIYGVDPDAAVKSTSFGAFQIMGFNHELCGFKDPLGFLAAMKHGAGAQTLAFVRFVLASPQLHQAMRTMTFPQIASHYNGPQYEKNQYHIKLRQSVRKFDAPVAA